MGSVLGLDLSLNAVGAFTWPVGCEGEWKRLEVPWMGRSSANTGCLFDRSVEASEFALGIVRRMSPSVVGIEAPYTGGQMSELLWGIYFLVLKGLKDHGNVLVVSIPNTSLKSIVVEYRRSLGLIAGRDLSKTDVIEAFQRKLKNMGAEAPRGVSSHEADAFWVWYVSGLFQQVWADKDPSVQLSKAEAHVVRSEELNSKGQRKGLIHREGDMFYDWRK